MTRPQLIGLSGYAQSGKDTSAGFLIEEGYTRVAFADTLRDALYALNPIVCAEESVNELGEGGNDSYLRVRDLVDDGGWDHVKTTFPEVRALLQRMGTEVGRDLFGENFWVDMAMRKVAGPTVFTDCRFPNEAETIKAAGGEVWRIVRPGTEPVNAHPSETALDNWDFDRIIHNTLGLDMLKAGVLL